MCSWVFALRSESEWLQKNNAKASPLQMSILLSSKASLMGTSDSMALSDVFDAIAHCKLLIFSECYLRMLPKTMSKKTDATKKTIKMKTVWSFSSGSSFDLSEDGGGGNLNLDFN